MPISYGRTSSEGPEMDMGWAYEDSNYGIPQKCWCGLQLKLDSSTGEENLGRRYYSCVDRYKEGSGHHIWKWWDEGVTETISMMQREIEEQRETVVRLERVQVFDPSFAELKEEVTLLQGEVSRLKEQIQGCY